MMMADAMWTAGIWGIEYIPFVVDESYGGYSGQLDLTRRLRK